MGRSNKRHRLLVTWAIRSGVVCLLVIALAMASRRLDEQAVVPGESVEGLTSRLTRELVDETPPIRFEEVTYELGIDFRHFPDERRSLLPEDMGSGVACGDFDNDGFTDLFFVNFAGSILKPPSSSGEAGRCRLYRNVGGKHFQDVTTNAGVGFGGYGMGAAWGDYDNDGDLDLYVTGFGRNALYQNRGDGTFRDVTAQAGVQDNRFSAGCSWADYDRDGDLDLYVCNYVEFVYREQDRGVLKQQYSTEQPYTLNPSAYAPLPNSLFRNNGDGTFQEVAASAGVADPQGKSLSAGWADLDNDGWPDLYVANDVSNNGVFRNKGDGTFEDIGPGSLAADYRGAMGIAVADFDNDLDQDLLITHWLAQENALYRNMTFDEMLGDETEGRLWFMDEADAIGLGQSSLDMVGWATGFADFDNDGQRDLWLINGSTLESAENHRLLVPQRAFVFWNRGQRGYIDVAEQASRRLSSEFVGRGGAQVDYDRDGRVDLVVLVHGGDAFVLRNVSSPTGHWLRIKLRQIGGNTYAVGAKVYLTTNASTMMAEVRSGSSYLSQHEQVLHFGLGQAKSVDSLRIIWPDGGEERHQDLSVDQELVFEHAAAY